MSTTDAAWYEFRNAVHARDFALAAELLRNQPSLLHLANSLGETVLHFLAVENDQEGVSWLHARGADLDTKNAFGIPVLFEVASLEYKDLFRWFVAQGANVRATDSEDQDLVLHLLEHERNEMAQWVRQNGA
jgi:ankyrin repeat protein